MSAYSMRSTTKSQLDGVLWTQHEEEEEMPSELHHGKEPTASNQTDQQSDEASISSGTHEAGIEVKVMLWERADDEFNINLTL